MIEEATQPENGNRTFFAGLWIPFAERFPIRPRCSFISFASITCDRPWRIVFWHSLRFRAPRDLVSLYVFLSLHSPRRFLEYHLPPRFFRSCETYPLPEAIHESLKGEKGVGGLKLPRQIISLFRSEFSLWVASPLWSTIGKKLERSCRSQSLFLCEDNLNSLTKRLLKIHFFQVLHSFWNDGNSQVYLPIVIRYL